MAGILSTYYFSLTGTFWAVTGEFTRWGGHLMQRFGARMAMGCNLAAFFTGIPQFSLHAWFFALANAVGSYFGAKFTLLPLFRIPVKLQKVSAVSSLTQHPARATRRFRLGMVGEPRPYPALATLEAMPQLKPGEISD